MYRRLAILTTLSVFTLSALLPITSTQAQVLGQASYTLQPGSSLWFNGSSTLNTFQCENRTVEGFGTIDSTGTPGRDGVGYGIRVENAFFYTEVHCLNCGVAPMDHDMYKALKASQYPDIHYILQDVRLLADSVATDSSICVETRGKLTVAGETNEIEMPVRITRIGKNKYLIRGSKLLSMHDYGIKPPTALWGLIRANDKLTVHFRLIAARDTVASSLLKSYEAVAQADTPGLAEDPR